MEFNHQANNLNGNTNYNYLENEDIFSFNNNEIAFKYKFFPNKTNKSNFIDNNQNAIKRKDNLNINNFTNKNNSVKMKGKNRKNTNSIYQNLHKDQNLFFNPNYFNNNNNLIEENYNILNNQYNNIRHKHNFTNNDNYNYNNIDARNKYSNNENMNINPNNNFNIRKVDNIHDLNNMNDDDYYIFNQIKHKNKNNKFQNNFNKKEFSIPKNNIIDNNFSLNKNININNDIKYCKKINLKNCEEFPNQRDNYNKFVENKIHLKSKKRVIEEKEDRKNEEESLSKIADDLFNYFMEQKGEKKPHRKNNIKNINLNKENKKGINININTKYLPDHIIQEKERNQHNTNQSEFKNRKYNIFQKNDGKDEPKDNIIKKEENKDYSHKISELIGQLKTINISQQKRLNRSIISLEDNRINENVFINKDDSKYVEAREIFYNDNKQDRNDNRLKMDYESEKIKNKKKVRKPKFDLNKNIYFNFVLNEEMNACQVRKGPNGHLECYDPRNEEDDINLNINFMKKPCIKPFNKDEIKVNEHYELCENMDEKDIIPDLYDENNEDINLFDEIFDLNNFDEDDFNIQLNLSINADISTDYSTNHSSIYSDLDNLSLNASFNNEGQNLFE